MDEPKHPPSVFKTCPICGATYQHREDVTIATCRKPDCIREYIRRGYHLKKKPAKGQLAEPARKKRTRGKPTNP